MENIYVAKLGKTVGLKGQLRLIIDTDFPAQFKKGATFITNKKQTLQIESVNLTAKTVKFVDIDTIEDAQKYINSQLFSTYEDTINNCKLEDKQYFWFDIENCTIYEDGKKLGVVKDIHRYPIDDYLEIKVDSELLKSYEKLPKTFMIPYNDNYIKNVDIESKEIQTANAIDIMEAS